MMKSLSNLLPMTLAAGLVVAPVMAFAQADGTPGNPPSTALGRTVDRATGNPTVPDGAPGNPPGTAAGRAAERVTGQAPAASPTTTTSATPGATTMAVVAGSVVTERPRLSQIIGGNVYNERNERVVEVDDVILVAPGGTAQAPMAIIQVGGFLGMGGRLVSVPLNDLRWNAENSRIVMPGASKEALQSRAPFEYNSLRRG